MKHVPIRNLLDNTQRCARCGEAWPCLIARGRDALLAKVRGEITTEEMVRRVSQGRPDA